jgi:transcription antitermination factor NusG
MKRIDPRSIEAGDPVLRSCAERKWCALHTRARHEKKVDAACRALKIPSYLPLRINRTFSGGKVNTFFLPMFPGYVFAALRTGEITQLKRTNSVAQRLEPEDEAGLLDDLRQVRAVELAQVELEVSGTFRRGQRVVVAQGPLAGVQGKVVRYKNRKRLQVAIGAINQAILVDVASDDLQPL